MIWGVIKSALGINTYIPDASSAITTLGSFWVLTVSVIFMACLIKMLSTAFEGSSVEQVDPVEQAKGILKEQQRKRQQEQQQQLRKAVEIDRVIKR